MVLDDDRLSVLIAAGRVSCKAIERVLLERCSGVVAASAPSGRAVREFLGRQTPDLLLFEPTLNELDNLALAAEVKAMRPDTVLIALVERGNHEQLLRSIALGVDHHLLKPIVPERVAALVARCAEVKRELSRGKHCQRQVLDLHARFERRVRERSARLKAAAREQEAVTYTVCHDLRAPLRHIESFSALLVDEFRQALPEEAQGYLDRIRGTTKRMEGMIEHLLELARVGRTPMKQEEVDLSAVAIGVATMLEETNPDQKVHVIIEKGLEVQGDQTLLTQLIQNLFSNAWKYSAGRPAARIELGRSQLAGRTVFFVRDNGVGFDMQHSARLFSLFQRLHGREFEGIGIGLAIVRRIVQRHHGSIWAEGRVNQGATFFFTLGEGEPAVAGGIPLASAGAQLSFPLDMASATLN